LTRDYAAFTAREAEIISIGPDGPNAFKQYWSANGIPFIGLPDPKHVVADVYNQEVHLIKLGRMPAIFVIDREGKIRYHHYGESMSDIPENTVILEVLDQLNKDHNEFINS
jgi:peroxiredoxin